LPLDTIVPVIMSCALLWWIGRRMNWTALLAVAAITLMVIIVILLLERSGPLRFDAVSEPGSHVARKRDAITTSAAPRIAGIPRVRRIARTSDRDVAGRVC